MTAPGWQVKCSTYAVSFHIKHPVGEWVTKQSSIHIIAQFLMESISKAFMLHEAKWFLLIFRVERVGETEKFCSNSNLSNPLSPRPLCESNSNRNDKYYANFFSSRIANGTNATKMGGIVNDETQERVGFIT